MPEFYSHAAAEHGRNLDEFTRGYIMALYFTESGDWDYELSDEENSANGTQFDIEDELSQSALARIIEDCATFQRDNAADLELYEDETGRDQECAGHDYWLTRNGHGCGFWDRGGADACARLTDAASADGSVYASRGDDGLVYLD